MEIYVYFKCLSTTLLLQTTIWFPHSFSIIHSLTSERQPHFVYKYPATIGSPVDPRAIHADLGLRQR